MTGHPVLTLRAMRDRRAEDVITGGLADFDRQVKVRFMASPMCSISCGFRLTTILK
jgi:hypothetical protein